MLYARNNRAFPREHRHVAVSVEQISETHEQQLRRLRGEVETLRSQLHQAQRLAAIGTMTSMVAHEFNNILTPIINYTQLAQENPAFRAKAIRHAAKGSRLASEICDAILGLAHTDRQTEPVNIRRVVGDALLVMARDPGKDGIDLKVSVPDDLEAPVRRVELQQVLLNLLMNARSAVAGKPRSARSIEVSARRAGRHVLIRVRDSGVGIDPADLERVFLPFFTTRRDEGGSGLGLAVCRDIVHGLGGEIEADSTPGDGATFTIRLPAKGV